MQNDPSGAAGEAMPPSSTEQRAAAATLVVAMPGRTDFLADHLADTRDLLHVTLLAAVALPEFYSASFAAPLIAALQKIDFALKAINAAGKLSDERAAEPGDAGPEATR